jgi:glycosyltransferase involved in cell wall biosynthesis
MKVSLIIPTYNRDEFLIDTIKCALNQKFEDYEVVVVDQSINHTPATLKFFEEHKAEFVYITSNIPSLTIARNLGVNSSKGEVIVMVDDDTIFNEHFISQHWNAIQSGNDVVSGRVEEGQQKTSKHPIWFNSWGRYSGSENCKVDGVTNKLAGCNSSFKRKVFEAIGGFDERFIQMANFEDADFGYRAYKAGFKIGFKASAELIHRKAYEGGAGNRNKYLFLTPAYYQNRFYFTRKNFPLYALYYLRLRFMIKCAKAAIHLVRAAEKDSAI